MLLPKSLLLRFLSHCVLVEVWLANCSPLLPSSSPPSILHPPPPPPLGSLGRQRAITMVIWTQIPHTPVHCDRRVLRWEGTKCHSNRFFLCFCFGLNSRWVCSLIHVLSCTGETARETVGVRETSWLEKCIEWPGNTLYKLTDLLLCLELDTSVSTLPCSVLYTEVVHEFWPDSDQICCEFIRSDDQMWPGLSPTKLHVCYSLIHFIKQ